MKRQKPEESDSSDDVLPSKQARTISPFPLSDGYESTTKITDLPNDALMHVMKFLSFKDLLKVESVNKRMQAVARTTWAMKTEISCPVMFPDKLRANFYDYLFRSFAKIKPRNIILLVKRMPNLRTLDLSLFSNIVFERTMENPQHRWSYLFSLAPKLTELDVSRRSLLKADVLAIGKFCRMLEKVNFQYSFDYFIDNGLKILFQKCPHLKFINLSHTRHLTGACFEFIPTGVKYLDLQHDVKVTSQSLITLGKRATDLESLMVGPWYGHNNINIWIVHFSNLKHLDLAIDFHYYFETINFNVLSSLESLVIRGEGNYFESFTSIVGCKKLKSLQLQQIAITSDDLLTLQQLKALKNLKLDQCTFPDLVDFVNRMDLEYLGIMKDAGAEIIGIVTNLLIESSTLKHLELRYSAALEEMLQRSLELPPESKIQIAVTRWPKDIRHLKCEWIDLICCEYDDYYQFANVRIPSNFDKIYDPES